MCVCLFFYLMPERLRVSLHCCTAPHASDFFHFKISRHCCGGDWKFEKKTKKNKSPKKWNIWLRKFNCKLWRGTMTVDAKHLAYYYYKLVITKLTWSYWETVWLVVTGHLTREKRRYKRTAYTHDGPSHWPLESSQTTQWPIFCLSLFSLSLSFFGMYFKILTVPWQRHRAAMSSTAP